MRHTPEPWKKEIQWIMDSEGRCIARVQNRELIEEAFANAQLMSAAPDMLKACMAAQDYLLNVTSEDFAKGTDQRIRDLLGAALAKATGMKQKE